MIYVTSDLHGYPKDKFLRFLSDSGFSDNDELYVLGDVIDRNGDGGIEMLRWIMGQPNVHFVLGNHEDMMLECSFIFDEITDQSIKDLSEDEMGALLNWLENGAKPTIDSLRTLFREEMDKFLERNAITKAEYTKSLGDLTRKMGMESLANNEERC